MIFLTMRMRCGQRRADPLSKTTIEEISEKTVKKKSSFDGIRTCASQLPVSRLYQLSYEATR